MERELKCSACQKATADSVVLTCNHRICYRCLESLLSHDEQFARSEMDSSVYDGQNPPKTRSGGSDSGYSTINSSSDYGRMQLYDGINQMSSATQLQDPSTPTLKLNSVPSLNCPVCNQQTFVQERKSRDIRRSQSMINTETNQPEFHRISRVDSFATSHSIQFQVPPQCEMCDVSAAVPAFVKCEQCQVRYCRDCLQRFHPPRGPLASHVLVTFRQGRVSNNPRARRKSGALATTPTGDIPPPWPLATNSNATNADELDGIKLSKCSFHVVEDMTMYCDECQVPLCYRCVDDGRHNGHGVQSIALVCKKYKADLSKVMSALSGKARRVTDLIVQLRRMPDEIQKSSQELEAQALSQCKTLAEAIEQKKRDILQLLNSEKERKCKIVRDQLQSSTMRLKRTSGLLEYCIEAMKDNDPTLFLQVSPGLVQRVTATEQEWSEDQLSPKTGTGMDVDLDSYSLMKAIEGFSITHRGVPEKPIIKISECSAVNNTVTLSWRISPLSKIDAFVLELDDGARGPFRDVYHGKQTACTIDGLHFDSVYRARVSAYNKAGRSPCSDVVQLQTSEVAIFRMDPNQSHRDIKLSHDHCTINCSNADQKVALSNTGFSRGIHYWEYSVDRYENSNTDIVVGVATPKVNTDHILGKDDFGWSMYVDSTRTWFLHHNKHTNRVDSGVQVGSRLGVLLNFENQSITYFVNQKQRGEPVCIVENGSSSAQGASKTKLLYPAVSLNKNVQLTLWSGLRPAFNGKNSVYTDENKQLPVGQPLAQANGTASTNGVSSLGPNSTNMAVGKRSQSSFDLKASQHSSERLYHSLPPKLAFKKVSVPVMPHTISKRASMMEDPRSMLPSKPDRVVKPPVKTKPVLPLPPRDDSLRRGPKPGSKPPPLPARKPTSDVPLIRVWEDHEICQ